MMAGFVTFAASQAGVLREIRFWAPLMAVVVTLAALQLVDWEQALRSPYGEAVMGLAAVALIASMATASTVPELSEFIFILYFGVVAFTAALGGRLLHWGATVALIAANLFMPVAYGPGARDAEEALVQSGTLIIVAAVTSTIANQFRKETFIARSSLTELRQRESDVMRLYEVSRTLSAGSSLTDVLPSLVGKVASYLGATVGTVLLYADADDTLDVVSPIWTSGHELDVGTYRIPLSRGGDLVAAFTEARSRRFEDIRRRSPDLELLGELGVDNAIVVPLKSEQRTIGLMVIADRVDRPFTERDVEALESLASPAALVLSQLGRYEEVAETSRRREELAQLKTDFVSVVSHELRTPLTSIIGALATLNRPELAPTNPSARELVSSAQKQSERLKRLIEDLLMMSRIDSAALPHHPENIRLDTFIHEIVAGIPGAARITTVLVQPGLSVEADPDHLARLLRNLIENSIKYAPDSDIEVTAHEQPGGVQLSVVDHGPGIPATQRDMVFERFSQLEAAQTRAQGGSGLGLSIVMSLVTSMGGTIRVTETPGGGATFTVRIPSRPGLTRPA